MLIREGNCEAVSGEDDQHLDFQDVRLHSKTKGKSELVMESLVWWESSQLHAERELKCNQESFEQPRETWRNKRETAEN